MQEIDTTTSIADTQLLVKKELLIAEHLINRGEIQTALELKLLLARDLFDALLPLITRSLPSRDIEGRDSLIQCYLNLLTSMMHDCDNTDLFAPGQHPYILHFFHLRVEFYSILNQQSIKIKKTAQYILDVFQLAKVYHAKLNNLATQQPSLKTIMKVLRKSNQLAIKAISLIQTYQNETTPSTKKRRLTELADLIEATQTLGSNILSASDHVQPINVTPTTNPLSPAERIIWHHIIGNALTPTQLKNLFYQKDATYYITYTHQSFTERLHAIQPPLTQADHATAHSALQGLIAKSNRNPQSSTPNPTPPKRTSTKTSTKTTTKKTRKRPNTEPKKRRRTIIATKKTSAAKKTKRDYVKQLKLNQFKNPSDKLIEAAHYIHEQTLCAFKERAKHSSYHLKKSYSFNDKLYLKTVIVIRPPSTLTTAKSQERYGQFIHDTLIQKYGLSRTHTLLKKRDGILGDNLAYRNIRAVHESDGIHPIGTVVIRADLVNQLNKRSKTILDFIQNNQAETDEGLNNTALNTGDKPIASSKKRKRPNKKASKVNADTQKRLKRRFSKKSPRRTDTPSPAISPQLSPTRGFVSEKQEKACQTEQNGAHSSKIAVKKEAENIRQLYSTWVDDPAPANNNIPSRSESNSEDRGENKPKDKTSSAWLEFFTATRQHHTRVSNPLDSEKSFKRNPPLEEHGKSEVEEDPSSWHHSA